MKQGELIQIVRNAGIEGYSEMWLDDEYACPTQRWIEGPFAQECADELERLKAKLRKLCGESKLFEQSVFDCEDFGFDARQIGVRRHRLTPKNIRRPGGLALAVFCYRPGGGSAGHAINFAVCSRQVVFFEPQSQKIVTLTKGEIASCSALLC